MLAGTRTRSYMRCMQLGHFVFALFSGCGYGLIKQLFYTFFKKCFLLYFFCFRAHCAWLPKDIYQTQNDDAVMWWRKRGVGCIRQAVWTVCPKMPPLPPPPIMKLYLSPSPPPPPSTISHSLSPTQMAVSCPPLSLPLSDDAFPSASLSLAYLFNKPPSFTLKKKDTDRRESKDRCCYLGDVLECRTNQLAARMF